MRNYGSTRTGFNSPWGRVHQSSHEFYWGQIQPESDPDTYYLIIDTEQNGVYKVDLAGFNRLVILMDDPCRRRYDPNRFINPPAEVVQVWYGLADPPATWCQGQNIVTGGHFWDASPERKVAERLKGSEFDVLLLGARKPRRGKRLRELLTNVNTYCVGGDWSDILPGKTYRHVAFGSLGAHKVAPENRVKDVKQVAQEASERCRVELITHEPDIKSYMSIRLPDILCRGACPIIDLDHDPSKLLLRSDELKENLYVSCEADVHAAVEYSARVTREALQKEYDLQVERAHRDMARVREKLATRVYDR